MMKRIVFWIGMTAWLGALPAAAQWSSSISLNTSFDNNAFRNYRSDEDMISQANVYLGRGWDSGAWGGAFFYDGYLTHFANFEDHTYQWHRVGVFAQRMLGSDGGRLQASARMTFRLDQEAYAYYDYSEFSGFAHLRWPLAKMGFLYLGYNSRRRVYPNISELSNWEHVLSARVNIPLPTRSTVILSSELGYKDYLSQLIVEAVETPETLPSGKGQGQFAQQNVLVSEVDNPSAGQWVSTLRISQAVYHGLGLSGYLRLRRNFGDGWRYIDSSYLGYVSEEELYDDRYGYESEELGLMLSALLPLSSMMRLGYDHYAKRYQHPVLDLNGDPLPGDVLRQDSRQALWGRLEKSFSLGQGGRSLKISLEYFWLLNRSNDLYYDYDARIGTLGFQVNF